MSSSGSGCGVTAFFILAFIASVVLNGVLLTGCRVPGKCPLCGSEASGKNGVGSLGQSKGVYDATDDLRDIASRLGLDTEGKDAAEIASSIKTQLYVEASAKGYPRELLTQEQFEKVKDVLPKERAEIVDAYHRFIKSLEGKRFVVVP